MTFGRSLLAAALPAFAVADKALTTTTSFGPKHCVSVSRNEKTGTCVLQTNCEGVSLDDVEFAFTCRKPGVIQKHSFGKGGFDLVEQFDTSVKCDVCGLPSEVAMSLKRARFLGSDKTTTEAVKLSEVKRAKTDSGAEKKGIKAVSKKQEPAAAEGDAAAASTEEGAAAEEPAAEAPAAEAPAAEAPAAEAPATEAPAQAAEESAPAETVSKVSYGPQNCVTTWLQKDAATTTTTTTNTVEGAAESTETTTTTVPVTDGEAGVCIVATNCGHIAADEFTNYPVGVIAVDKDNVPVRHLFGKNSFDPQEEFNTLIRASACVGMDQTAEAITLDNEVKALSRIVFALKGEVKKLAGGAAQETALLRKDHELLMRNDGAAQIERDEEERERREEDREQQMREERAAERREDQEGRSTMQLADESDNEADEADLPPEFRNEHEERLTREEAESERD